MSIVKTWEELKTYPHVFVAVDGNGSKHNEGPYLIYKYMDMQTAISCLENGNIRFSQPTEWPDKYEQHFYTANYENVTTNLDDTPGFLACCFTINKISEASWKTYTYGKTGIEGICVKFKLSRKELRINLLKNNTIKEIYEGFMNYSLSDQDIQSIHRKGPKTHYDEVFGRGFSRHHYLSLMLLKRVAFEYEKEFRFIVIKDIIERKKLEKSCCFPVNWAEIIKGVEVGDDCPAECLNKLKAQLKKVGVGKKIINNIEKVNLYEDPCKKPIKIEENNNAKNGAP